MDSRILKGIRILDFTWMLAGPFATRILADFGAEVIKVQSKKIAKGMESNLTWYFNQWNRNKLGITLDMNFPEARDIAMRLVKVSDVVIENFSPRVISNWGFEYERIKEIKPDIIMVSISAMGRNGSWRDLIGFGTTLQSLSGITYLTSFEKECPLGIGYPYVDSIIGLYATFAILSALENRKHTGKGQYIDLSGFEASMTLLGPTLLDILLNQTEVFPQGNRSNDIEGDPYGCYKCMEEDRWCVIAINDEDQWRALSRVMGDPPWTREERFSTLLKRKENSRELDELLTKWTSTHKAEEIVNLLQREGIPSGVVQNAHDIANDPHLRERGFFVSLKHPILGDLITDRQPIVFERDAPKIRKPAPLLGEDNRYVFVELLGLEEDKFKEYIEKGIIG
jgi:crotonobetainyl-CoA:carnitine CoA-transferase CaiB-like acyl-CoA transferase